MYEIGALLIILPILGYASYHDIRYHEIYNCISVELFFIKMALLIARPFFMPFFIDVIEGLIICGVPALITYVFSHSHGIGGGDVRLMFAIGFLLGYEKGLISILILILLKNTHEWSD